MDQIMMNDDNTRIIGVSDGIRKEIEKVVIPEGVITIEPAAFRGCSKMTSVQLPSTLRTIGSDAFRLCYSLKEIVLPEGLKNIEAGAFECCSGSHGDTIDIRIPASVEYIGEKAFAISGIDRIEVDPNNPYYFSRDGVLYKRNPDANVLVSFLRKDMDVFTVDSDITAFDTSSFMCSNVKTVIMHDHMKSLGEEYTFWMSQIEQIELPASIQHIPVACFADCKNLRYLKISQAKDSAYHIGRGAFVGNCPLDSLHVYASDLTKFNVNKKAFNSTQYKKTVLYVSGRSIEEFRQHPVFGKFKIIREEGTNLLQSNSMTENLRTKLDSYDGYKQTFVDLLLKEYHDKIAAVNFSCEDTAADVRFLKDYITEKFNGYRSPQWSPHFFAEKHYDLGIRFDVREIICELYLFKPKTALFVLDADCEEYEDATAFEIENFGVASFCYLMSRIEAIVEDWKADKSIVTNHVFKEPEPIEKTDFRPTIEFLKENFVVFNAKYFESILPMPTFQLMNSKNRLGCYVPEESAIRISEDHIGTHYFFQCILLHEMIHYYLHDTNQEDRTPHGTRFKEEVRRINNDGWNVGFCSKDQSHQCKYVPLEKDLILSAD